ISFGSRFARPSGVALTQGAAPPQEAPSRIAAPKTEASGAFCMSHDPVLYAPMAGAIRALSMDAVEAANAGHPGMPMGMADVATVLWSEYLKFDPAAPNWADRDRFVLSAGHGSMLVYALLNLSGYAHPTLEEIANFRQLGSPCAGHPENFLIEGVEATTGPLGQGLAMAVGRAIAERHLNAEFGHEVVRHRTGVHPGGRSREEIANSRQLGSPCAGHPEDFLIEGVEATTGPRGQGLALAVGMAIAERHLNAEFGDELVDHRTWVVAGDGCLMEGVNHEAIGL